MIFKKRKDERKQRLLFLTLAILFMELFKEG